VVNHNSQVAVVLEPSSVLLLVVGGIAVDGLAASEAPPRGDWLPASVKFSIIV
jgi:hypothetical protein